MSGNTHSQPIPRQTGRVKWFNNKAGFGFITICSDSESKTDVFVHYSSINVTKSQYKYLVEGEYVDFDLAKPDKGDHEFHAVNVTGVKGGELMCETAKAYVSKKPREIKDGRELREPKKTKDVIETREPKKTRDVGKSKNGQETREDGFISVAYRHKKVDTKAKPNPKTKST